MTLVEVVAGLALMATLLVSILIAFGTHVGQVRAAENRMRAIAYADGLLSHWLISGSLPAVGESGRIEGTDDLWWRMVDGENRSRAPLELHTLRLDVIQRAKMHDDQIVTSVELFQSLDVKPTMMSDDAVRQ